MSSKLKIVKPVFEELGQLTKTAGEQIVGTSKSSEEQTKEVVKHLYGADRTSVNEKPKTTEIQKQEEAQKQKLRQELHAQYYQRLVNPPKPKEERPAERVERQEKEDRWKLEEKKAKEKPIIVRRAAEKTEKYPGASG